MARKRASMREGPLAELFRATEAAQEQAEKPKAKDEAGRPRPRRRSSTLRRSSSSRTTSPPRARAACSSPCRNLRRGCIAPAARSPRRTWP
jgi:hypothetical protein